MYKWYAVQGGDDLYSTYEEACEYAEMVFEDETPYFDGIYEVEGFEELLDFFDHDIYLAAQYVDLNDIGILEQVSKIMKQGGGMVS